MRVDAQGERPNMFSYVKKLTLAKQGDIGETLAFE